MSKNASERNAQKRNIMTAAWTIVRRTGKTLAEALKAAWREFKLKLKMIAGDVYFSYLTKDNGIRVAHGTLVPSAISYVPNGRGRPTQSHLFLYWDLDKDGYRSFDRANVLTVC